MLSVFIYSTQVLGMKVPYTKEEIIQAIVDTIKKNNLKSCYIRPLAYFGDAGSVRVLPMENHPVDMIIACLPMGRYLDADSVDVMVSDYIRIHPKSTVCDAKISGHYVNSLLATMACQGTKYHEALLLDARGNVAEGAAQNIFFVKNGEMITTPLGTILDGITRRLVIELAQENNIAVHERYFKVDEIIHADEAFFSGTAAEITPIASIADKCIGTGEAGKVTQLIKKCFEEVTQAKTHLEALTFVDG